LEAAGIREHGTKFAQIFHAGGLSLLLNTQARTILKTVLFTIAWTAAVAYGTGRLLTYESAPGRIGATPSEWPAASRIQRATDRATLVMLAHPLCPCTRASIDELAKIMARIQGKVSAYVVFLKPQGSGADWENTGLRRTAAEIPGVMVLSDVDGAEAQRFGVETSGHTVLFDGGGHLLFSGGITESRGHSGDNAGERAIVSLVNNHAAERTRTFVFGCSLFNHNKIQTAGQYFKCKAN